MNFKKVLIGIVPLVVLIVAFKFLTRVDRSNPVAVGNAFTKALKAEDTSSASGYFVPDKAVAWRAAADENLHKMQSGTHQRFFENIPSSPAFTSANGSAAGTMTLKSSDNAVTLEMLQVDGKWYVSKGPV